MKVFYSDHFLVPLPQNHRFPMPKYAQTRQALLKAGFIPAEAWTPSERASDEQLLHVHAPEYLERLVGGRMTEREMRRIGFPWSLELTLSPATSLAGYQ